MIEITPSISIEEHEISEQFMRSPGAGGQKVNKTESAVQLRYSARTSPALSNAVCLRLTTLAGRRMTKDGVIIITANQFRTQELNRRDAMNRLIALIRDAAVTPKFRRPTRVSKGVKKRRLDSKRRHSNIKTNRGRVRGDD